MLRHVLHIGLALTLGLATLGSNARSWAQSSAAGPAGMPALTKEPQKPAAREPIPPEERVRIYSDRAIYKRQEKRAQAIGHVKIIQDNTTIFADEVLYNEESKQSFVENGVKIIQINKKEDKGRTTVITAVKMTAYHEEKRIFLKEDVRMDRAPYAYDIPKDYTDDKAEKRKRVETAIKKDHSVITSDQMEYFTRSENANLLGNVVLLQKDKKVTGGKAFIRGEQDGDMIIIEENAVVTQINGNWLIVNKIIKPDPKDEEQQRFIKEKLVMAGDKITIFRATDDMKAEGNVRITQKVGGKERVAVGDQATFSDREQLATLTGNVKIQRENGDWLTADKALFFTEKEAFEAFGTSEEQVISEFTIDEEDERSSKEPINQELPPLDLKGHQPGERLPSWLRSGQQPQRAPAKPATDTSRPASPPDDSPSPQQAPANKSGTRAPKQSPTPKPVESSFTINTDS